MLSIPACVVYHIVVLKQVLLGPPGEHLVISRDMLVVTVRERSMLLASGG